MSSSRKLIDEATFFSKYLVKDLYYCVDYAEELESKAKLLKENNEDATVRQWLKKREALQEKIQKILVNAKEEWRVVLQIVPEIMRICLGVLEQCPPKSDLFDMSLDLLRSVSLCINPKRMGRYWPTEVRWLPLVTSWTELYLKDYTPKDYTSSNVLILWLASAVKTPFDLSRFDRAGDNPLAVRIATIIDSNVDNYAFLPVIHLLTGSYYSRPDCYSKLTEFIPKLSSILLDPSKPMNSKLCCLRIMASLLKSVPRTIMLKHVDDMVDVTLKSIDSEHEQCVKMCMKICGRSALVHLKPRDFKWRYRCGKRVIQLAAGGNDETKSATDSKPQENDGGDDTETDDLYFPKYFEKLLQTLMENLVHKFHVIRYSVAKYLANIGSRLPYEYSNQILTSVFDFCQPMEDDQYWQGACLALAEFVRRGYVPIESMPKVVEILEYALFFEQIQGSFSAGANVRDAACYICWSMGRAYEGELIADYVVRLAPILLSVACFDPVVSCRRAASAVIQELAGRTQKFPHWADVIPRLEFHELSKIELTYLEIGVYFAHTYEEFSPTLVENLLNQKTIHWDPKIRRLASKTLSKIVTKRSQFGQECFKKFFDSFDRLDRENLNFSHGRFLAISHLLESDQSLQEQTPVISKIYDLFNCQVLKLSSYSPNSLEANLMRECLLILVEKCLALWRKNLPDQESAMKNVRAFLLNSVRLNESNELVQSASIDALICFMNFENDKDGFLLEMIDLIPNHGSFIVSTVTQFLCRFYVQMESPEIIEKVLKTLNDYLDRWFDQEIRRPETIADISRTILKISAYFFEKLTESMRKQVQQNVLRCLDDHSITKSSGDTGQPVRRETIENIYDYVRKISADELLEIIKLLASEAALHRTPTFLITLTQLRRISQYILKDDRLQSLKSLNLEKILILDPICSEDFDLYKECTKLLECSELANDLWRGFVCVLADPIEHKFAKLIIDFIKNSEHKNSILEHFLEVANAKARCQRLSIPFMSSAHILLTQMNTGERFPESIAKFAWAACEKTANPRKYILACDIFCALTLLGRLQLAMNYLYVLLCHRFPRIRTYTATQFYSVILSLDYDDNGEKMEKIEEISNILQKTDWLDLTEAKRNRETIRTLIKDLN